MRSLLLYLKGVAMGAADVVPGVSGGTIAFISGIYETLLQALRSTGSATNCSVLFARFITTTASSDFQLTCPADSWLTPFSANGTPLPANWISQVPTEHIHACTGSTDSGEPPRHSR